MEEQKKIILSLKCIQNKTHEADCLLFLNEKDTYILREKIKCNEYFAFISSFIYAMAAIGQLLSSS